nr:restriction endonuclease subunit S [Clostridia bacterium]
MAKAAKKETALTPEEKLEMALVPNIEQLYPVLDNWCWVKQGTVSLFINGRAYKQVELLEDPTATPVLRVGNLFTNGTWYFSDLSLEEDKYIDDGELIYAWSASFGPFIWHGGRVIYHYHIWKIMLSDALLKEYYYYWLMHDTERLKKQGHGTGMIHVTKEIMESSPMPLPPLAEQQRIVDRIESLFAKLDEAKEKAQAVVDGFEDRKAAILHKAFTGELTEKWRKNNGVDLNAWKKYCLKECCSIGSGGTPSRKEPENYEGNIPWIKTGEIDWNYIYDSEEHISEDAIANSSAKIYPIGAVLVAMYGMGVTRGRASILKIPAATNQAVCVLQPYDYLLNRYLFYFFMCNYWDIREKAVGGNQLNLSATIIGKLEIRIPPIEEQKEIVSMLDGILGKDSSEKEIAEQVISNIESLKKAILTRAFRGELGTNDPNDESAIELLKRVLK